MEAVIDNLNLPVSKTWQSGVLAEFEFEKYQAQVADWKKKADDLVITDASQLTEMKLADDGRKILQKIRTSIEKKRKELKEQSLQEGRAIDAIAKALTGLVEPIERTLEEKAKYAENLEKARIQKLHDERLDLILPYLDAVPVGINYGSLDNGTWTAVLSHAKQEHEERIAAQEASRIAAEEAERKRFIYNERRVQLAPYNEYGFFDLHIDTTEEEFQAMITEGRESKRREDTERAQREHDARVLAAEKQQELDRLHLQHKREKMMFDVDFNPTNWDFASMPEDEFQQMYDGLREEYNRKLAEKKRAEEEEQARIEAAKAAEAAPDIEKLRKLIKDLYQFELPKCTTPKAIKVVSQVETLIAKIITHVMDSHEELADENQGINA